MSQNIWEVNISNRKSVILNNLELMISHKPLFKFKPHEYDEFKFPYSEICDYIDKTLV